MAVFQVKYMVPVWAENVDANLASDLAESVEWPAWEFGW